MADEIVKSSIQVVTRMMQLLETLATHASAVTLKQLAMETRLHPSTAHRILNAMVLYRMVERVEPGIYQLGTRLHELGALVAARNAKQPPAPLDTASPQPLSSAN